MSNIAINNKNRTIEINKTFAKNAALFGTPEYSQLQEVRRDYPTYRVVTVAKKGAMPEHKGLTFEYMEKYISLHDDKEMSKMDEYLTLRGLDEDGKRIVDAIPADYATVKNWFFQAFPEIGEYHKKRDALLERIANRQAEILAEKAA